MKLSSMQHLRTSCHFSPLRFKYSPECPVLNSPQPALLFEIEGEICCRNAKILIAHYCIASYCTEIYNRAGVVETENLENCSAWIRNREVKCALCQVMGDVVGLF
jgi:hypothetical protein